MKVKLGKEPLGEGTRHLLGHTPARSQVREGVPESEALSRV